MLTTLIMLNAHIPEETDAEYFRRRFTDAAQKTLFSGDRGLEHVSEIPGKKVAWGEREIVVKDTRLEDVQ